MDTPPAPGPGGSAVIAAAYEAERRKLTDHEQLRTPTWQTLPIELRVIMIGVYFAGRKSRAEEDVS